jgi:predicted ribosome quality control (RQC) complex YloA/Tae2 family protein
VHNNYFLLRQLTVKLEAILSAAVVSECFSQNKDELIIRFERKGDPFFIRASLSPAFSCLSFPENFHRARKNSIDLFERLIGQRVEGIRQFENERSFAIQFSNAIWLLFKMHGNRSNILMFENNVAGEFFKNNVAADTMLTLDTLDRKIDWGRENFEKHHDKPESIYFTFGKEVWRYLKTRHYQSQTPEQQWDEIQHVLGLLNDPIYYIIEAEQKINFSLLPSERIVKQFQDPIGALNEFFAHYSQHNAFISEKASGIARLRSRIEATENYLQKTRSKLLEIENDNNYKIWADLLMANLHSIKPGTERVILPDFYHENHEVEIKIKKDLSPQKNAALFYKKSKNQQIEINHLQTLIESKQKENAKLVSQQLQLETAHDLKSLRKAIQDLNIPEKEKQVAPLPYREFEYNGFKIWIGKNAQSNDIVTLKYGYKEDLWLHAKDVAGSHVLLKHQAGKNFPKDAIEFAAQLAAYYSKRKNESLCPVTVTPRKYVRKRKGDPAGMVVVEREEVMMVEPSRGD